MNWETRFQQGLDLRNGAKPREALALFEGLLSEDAPSNDHLAALHGEIGGIHLFDLSSPAEARDACAKCVELSPRSEMASLGLFHSLVELGELITALDEAKRLLALRPSDEYRALLESVKPVD